MSFGSWLSRSIGRTREGTKAHLVLTAELLEIGEGVLLAMRSATDDECESMLIEHVTSNCGGTADGREHPSDIIDMLIAFLPPDAADLLRAASIPDGARPPAAVWQMDEHLSGSRMGVRALDSFGDNYIVMVVPRELLQRFDVINKYWLAAN
jgi:hypothetical protein